MLDLDPDGTAEVRHVVGALPRPDGWTEIAALEVKADELLLTDISGASITMPYASGFLA